MPMPVSVVRISISSGEGLNVSMVIRPCAGVNFTLFLIRFQKTCCKRAGSPSTCMNSARKAEFDAEILREDFFPADFIGALQDLMDVHRLEAELELALRDAGDIEQVVDQSRFQLDVATDDCERVPDFRRIRRARFEFADHGDDGRERVAQLVREQGEKLVLGGVRADQFLAQSHVARLVFHQIKHALDALIRALEAQEVDVDEVRLAALVGERLLDELEGGRRTRAPSRSPRRARSALRRRLRRRRLCPSADPPKFCAMFAKASFAWRKLRESGSTSAMPLGMLARIFSLKITSRSIRREASRWRRVNLPASHAPTAVRTMSQTAGKVILPRRSRDRLVGRSLRLLHDCDPARRLDRG